MVMTNLSDKARAICEEHYTDWGTGCNNCPLLDGCHSKLGDSYDIWAERMNKAADKLDIAIINDKPEIDK